MQGVRALPHPHKTQINGIRDRHQHWPVHEDGRDPCSRNRVLETHGMCMPLDPIYRETDLEAVDLSIWFYRHGLIGIRRPRRGHRGDHPSAPIFAALLSRRAVLV